jgi:hypothetical protein
VVANEINGHSRNGCAGAPRDGNCMLPTLTRNRGARTWLSTFPRLGHDGYGHTTLVVASTLTRINGSHRDRISPDSGTATLHRASLDRQDVGTPHAVGTFGFFEPYLSEDTASPCAPLQLSCLLHEVTRPSAGPWLNVHSQSAANGNWR